MAITAQWAHGPWGSVPWFGGVSQPANSLAQAAVLPSRVAFGPSSIGVNLAQQYIIPSRVAFGPSAIIRQSYLSVFLDGVDISNEVLVNSIQITNPLSNSTTATFGIWDKTSTIVPQVGQEVQIYLGSIRIFGGSVEQPFQTGFQALGGYLYAGSGGGSGGVGSATSGAGGSTGGGGVTCTDYSNLLDRRYVGQYYDGISVPTTLSGMVADIVRIYFAQDGIAYDFTGDPGINLGPTTFAWVTGRQAFNQLSSLTGWDFSVDNYKVLRFYPPTLGIGDAPFNVQEIDGLVPTVFAESLGIEYYRGTYRNRQGIRAPSLVTQVWSDTFSTAIPGPFPNEPQPPDGVRRFFGELYDFTGLPTVTVNGSPQVVININNPSTPITTPGAQWYVLLSGTSNNGTGYGVSQIPSQPVLTSSDTLVISYAIPLPPIYWVQDDAQIAARAAIEGNSGIYEDVQDAPNGVTDPAAIIVYAESLLVRYGSSGIPFQVTYSCRVPGPGTGVLFAGMLQQIVVSNPPVSFVGMISQVNWQDVDGDYMQLSVTVLSGKYQGDFTQFFAALAAQAQLPQPTSQNTYAWVLGPSVPGVASPGVTQEGYVTPQIGVIQNSVEILLSFSVNVINSVNTGVHYNLMVNGSLVGVGIFFPGGEVGFNIVYQTNLASPIRLHAGDQLQIQVFFDTLFSRPVIDATVTANTSVVVT